MIKHELEQIRRALRLPHARHGHPAVRPAPSAGQLTPRQLRDEVLALLG
ncbi:MAG TPA: hypothetical protein VI199_04230 [Novosphingobium sp.]